MKNLTKKIILFFGFIILIALVIKTPTVDAKTLSQICLTMNTTVNVINASNFPSGKTVYVGCNGDGGDTAIQNAQCKVSKGVDWCKGEIEPVINGHATLTHCSCPPYADGCLKVLISSSAPSIVNACSRRPKVPTGAQYSDSTCTTAISGIACGINGSTIKPVVNITCPAPKVDVPVKVYIDNDNNNVLNKSTDTLYTGNISIAEGGSAFTGTGTTTIPGLTIGSKITATLANITSYNIITTAPLANPVTNYTVLSSGNEIDFLIQAPRCTPKTTCDAGQICGTISDGCGGTVTCTPGCTDGQQCQSDQKSCNCPTGTVQPFYICGENQTCTKQPACGVSNCETEGAACNVTSLSFAIGLDGIGKTGDRVNSAYAPVQNAAGKVVGAGSNPNPTHPTRPIMVYLTDSAKKTTEYDGTITYDPTSGKFKASSINLGADILAGDYTVIASVGAHLKKSLGSVTIKLKQDNPITTVADFVAGDLTGDVPRDVGNADNLLNILDYNVLMSCNVYSKDDTICKSHPQFYALSDLEDNGTVAKPQVDEYDYNLWLREFSTGNGQYLAGDEPPADPNAAVTAAAKITSECNLLTQDCQTAGQACYQTTTGTVCLAAGITTDGETCTQNSECINGSSCNSGVCGKQYCDLTAAAGCTTGQVCTPSAANQDGKNNSVGICVTPSDKCSVDWAAFPAAVTTTQTPSVALTVSSTIGYDSPSVNLDTSDQNLVSTVADKTDTSKTVDFALTASTVGVHTLQFFINDAAAKKVLCGVKTFSTTADVTATANPGVVPAVDPDQDSLDNSVNTPADTQTPTNLTGTPIPSVTVTGAPADVTGVPVVSVTQTPVVSVTQAPEVSVTQTPVVSVTEAPAANVSEAPAPVDSQAPAQ